ncbi:MAG: hypothetical protein CV045_10460 [Cyanobacteria bacterium M5B4]|nr:MAG: hypothetical protein CV045_10460 [Cyanobacteria bacterium M5B4]
MSLEELDARLDRIAALIEADRLAAERRAEENAKNIEQDRLAMEEFRQTMAKMRQETQEEIKRWDERFFQLSRDNLNISRTIIVTAGAAVIFAPFLQAVVPAILALIKQQS